MNTLQHIEEYSTMIADGLRGFDREQFEKIVEALYQAYFYRNTVYLAGNGGSASMSDHFMCDHQKGISFDTHSIFPKIICLSNNTATITAYANDIGYDVIFSRQLSSHGEEGDVLVVISASGNSPNIIAAIETAKILGMKVISFTGFTGGRAKEMSDLNIHIPINNYGVVEDCHQIVMHMLAQHFRKTYAVDIEKVRL